MKITIVGGFFLPVPPVQGGAMEKIWLRLAESLAAAGHEVTYLSRRWPGFPDRETRGRLHHRRIPGMNHTRRLALNLLYDFWWGVRVTRALPPGDFVICNTVALPVWLRRVKPSAGRVLVSLARMPKGQIRAYGAVDCLLATSEAVAAQVRRERPGLADRTVLFPNPIDWDLHAQASAKAVPLTIGYVGRINPEKGLEQLLDAAVWLAGRTEVPPWRLRLIGPANVAQGGGGEAYRQGLIDRYAPALGTRLEFVPPIFAADALAREYGAMDIFCYPSLAAKGEGLSVAPIEAMAAGAVPVLSSLDCYQDMLEPGRNGFQFDHTRPRPDIAAELGGILARLLRDATLRQTLALAAQATARRYDYDTAARALIGILERLTAAGGRAN